MSENKIDDAAKVAPPSQWLEFGPIAVFVIVFNVLRLRGFDNAMMIAATVFMILAVAALIFVKSRKAKVPPMLLLTTIIIVVTVLATLLTGDKRFFYMKPTVVNILFGLGVIGGVLFKKNIMKMLMGQAYAMPEKAWNIFAVRWGLFFFVMAAINELVWRTQSEAFWANFKLFGFVPLTLVFILSQLPFLLKHSDLKDKIKSE